MQENNTAYFSQVRQYNILSPQEEKKLLETIHTYKDLEIINNSKNGLDFSVLFSLLDSDNYLYAIDILRNYYQKNENEGKDTKVIEKYYTISVTLNRPLNSEEVLHYFDIEIGKEKINKVNLLDEINNFIKYKNAINKIIISNWRLVTKIANRYSNIFDVYDLMQEGNIGLIKAAINYDIDSNYAFSTYATHWIKGYILRFINDKKRIIRIPISLQEKFIELNKKIKCLQEKEPYLNDIELAKSLNISIDFLIQFRILTQDILPLDEMIIDTLSYEDDNFENIEQIELKKQISELISTLPQKEASVLKMFYGFSQEKLDYKQIEEKLSLKRYQSFTIRRKAINHLQKKVFNDAKYSELETFIR